jgi:hypothetical protein
LYGFAMSGSALPQSGVERSTPAIKSGAIEVLTNLLRKQELIDAQCGDCAKRRRFAPFIANL